MANAVTTALLVRPLWDYFHNWLHVVGVHLHISIVSPKTVCIDLMLDNVAQKRRGKVCPCGTDKSGASIKKYVVIAVFLLVSMCQSKMIGKPFAPSPLHM